VAELNHGLVVESVARNFEGEKAGLAEGDIILSWSRGDTKGQIESPFDLSEIEAEQAPRGRVMLEGKRGEATQIWAIGPDKWGIQTRPNLTGSLLDIYLEGQEQATAGKLNDAVARWHAAAEGRKYLCSWFGPWLLFHASETLANARQWKDASALYQEAVGHGAGVNSEIRAQLLQALSEAFKQQSDWANAEKYQQEALREIQHSGLDSLSGAEGLTNLGNIAKDRGDLNKAEEYYRQGLEIRKRLAPDSLDLAASLNNLGRAAFVQGDLVGAEDYYHQGLEIMKKVAPDSLGMAVSLNGLGNVGYDRGELDKAEEYHRQALEIREKLAPGSLDVTASLNNLGMDLGLSGDLAKAEEYVRQALAIAEKLAPSSLNVAVELGNLGSLVHARGDVAKSAEYHRQALEIREKLAPGSLDVAKSLNNLGEVARDSGDLDRADEYYRQAIAIQEKLAPNSLDVAQVLNNLGEVARNRGDLDKAEEYHSQALAIYEKFAPGSKYVASGLSYLGDVARSRRDFAKALECYEQALKIGEKLNPGVGQAELLADLAGIKKDTQQLEEAEQLYAQAIDVIENQLAHLGGSSDVRAGFRAKHADYYSAYADLLLTQKKPELAFQVLEQSRARTLLETLTEAHVNIRQGADPSLLERERSLRVTLTAKSNRKIDLLQAEHTEAQVAAFTKEIDELLSQYQEVEGQIRTSSPNYAALTQPKPLSPKEVQKQLLDGDTVLLEYSLGEKGSFVFMVTPTSLDSYELPKRSEIDEVAHHVYDLLTSRNRWIEGETSAQRKERIAKGEAEYRKTVVTLSQMILSPVAAQLGKKCLLVVADGALQYIPFAVLPDPSQPAMPLVAEHEIVNLPSASVLASLRRQAEGRRAWLKDVAVLADPVFDKEDPRVGRTAKNKQVMESASVKETIRSVPESSFPEQLTRSLGDIGLGTRQAGSALPRLAFSRQEADTITAMTASGKGMEALDFKASRETALSRDLGQYRIVHFATHGLLDNEHPELSGLVLSLVDEKGKSRDGFLDLEDVYNLTLPADLVVLSACETGLGKQITGEGLVGLTRGFMFAGATRVVASLWKVDDVATAELMGRFYGGMLREGLQPAAALRQAQIEIQKQKRWSDPYYWAAFTIQGEWK
jgi:CHAT domain-containing protein/Tfp pilus assembly protein PilF